MSTEAKIEEKISVKIEPPKLWKVVFLNDNKTPMEFVIDLLSGIFKHSEAKARDITMEIHNTGSGIAGTYPFEIAETRSIEATNLARSHNFPLRITLEEE
jgi:ATP-dependent Clp protease adaptor protein ClpS